MRNFAISLLFKREPLCSRKRAVLVQVGYLENTAENFVRRPTTILFPLDSAIFYPDGNFQGNTMENSGKQNPKTGFKSPQHIVRVHATSKWLKCKHLRHEPFYVKHVIHIIVFTFATLSSAKNEIPRLPGLAATAFIKGLHWAEGVFNLIRNPYLRHAIGMLVVGIMIYWLFQGFGHYYVEGVGYSTVQDVLLGGLASAPLLGLLFCCKLTATSF